MRDCGDVHTPSSAASVNASGTVRLSEPLSLSYSPARSRPHLSASRVVLSTSRCGVGVLAIPPYETPTDVIDVNAPQLTVAVTNRERHRRVVASRVRQSVMRN